MPRTGDMRRVLPSEMACQRRHQPGLDVGPHGPRDSPVGSAQSAASRICRARRLNAPYLRSGWSLRGLQGASDAGLAECGDHLAHNVSLTSPVGGSLDFGSTAWKRGRSIAWISSRMEACLVPVRPPADGMHVTFRVATFPALECLWFVSRLLRPHDRQHHDIVALWARIVREPSGATSAHVAEALRFLRRGGEVALFLATGPSGIPTQNENKDIQLKSKEDQWRGADGAGQLLGGQTDTISERSQTTSPLDKLEHIGTMFSYVPVGGECHVQVGYGRSRGLGVAGVVPGDDRHVGPRHLDPVTCRCVTVTMCLRSPPGVSRDSDALAVDRPPA